MDVCSSAGNAWCIVVTDVECTAVVGGGTGVDVESHKSMPDYTHFRVR